MSRLERQGCISKYNGLYLFLLWYSSTDPSRANASSRGDPTRREGVELQAPVFTGRRPAHPDLFEPLAHGMVREYLFINHLCNRRSSNITRRDFISYHCATQSYHSAYHYNGTYPTLITVISSFGSPRQQQYTIAPSQHYEQHHKLQHHDTTLGRLFAASPKDIVAVTHHSILDHTILDWLHNVSDTPQLYPQPYQNNPLASSLNRRRPLTPEPTIHDISTSHDGSPRKHKQPTVAQYQDITPHPTQKHIQTADSESNYSVLSASCSQSQSQRSEVPDFILPSPQTVERYGMSYIQNNRLQITHRNAKSSPVNIALHLVMLALGAQYLFETRNSVSLYAASRDISIKLWTSSNKGHPLEMRQ